MYRIRCIIDNGRIVLNSSIVIYGCNDQHCWSKYRNIFVSVKTSVNATYLKDMFYELNENKKKQYKLKVASIIKTEDYSLLGFTNIIDYHTMGISQMAHNVRQVCSSSSTASLSDVPHSLPAFPS